MNLSEHDILQTLMTRHCRTALKRRPNRRAVGSRFATSTATVAKKWRSIMP